MKFSVTVDRDEDGRNRGLPPVYSTPVEAMAGLRNRGSREGSNFCASEYD